MRALQVDVYVQQLWRRGPGGAPVAGEPVPWPWARQASDAVGVDGGRQDTGGSPCPKKGQIHFCPKQTKRKIRLDTTATAMGGVG